MSRIGVRPITIPAGVEVTVEDNNVIKVKGPKGELCQPIAENLTVEIEENVLTVKRPSDSKQDKSQHGLGRTLIHNMVEGVSKGYEVKMTVNGVGYTDATTIIVKGCDKAEVGNYAANIRAWRKPEPYKGKGIIYDGEVVHKKEGKSGASA